MLLIQVRWREKSHSLLTNLKNWDFGCLIRIKCKSLFESFWKKATQKFSKQFNLNHILHMIRIIKLWVTSASVDSNLTLHLIQIMQFFTFSQLAQPALFESNFTHDSNHGQFDSSHTFHLIRIN